jgi:hypothetical protein
MRERRKVETGEKENGVMKGRRKLEKDKKWRLKLENMGMRRRKRMEKDRIRKEEMRGKRKWGSEGRRNLVTGRRVTVGMRRWSQEERESKDMITGMQAGLIHALSP